MAAIAYLKYASSLVRTATLQANDPAGAHPAYTVDANFPLANVKTIPVQRPTKIEIPAGSDTEIHIQIDFGSTVDFDLVVIAGHNLSSTAIVTLKAGAAQYPTTTIASPTWRAGTIYHKFSATQSYRYLQIGIDDANSTYDDVSIGLIMAGEYTQTTLSLSEGWDQEDEAVNIRNEGDWITPISRNLFNRRRVAMNFENATEAKFEELVTLYNSLAQDVFPAFLFPDSAVNYGFVGRFAEPIKRTYAHSATGSGAGDELVNASVVFVEDANPILLNGTQWTP
jgi:hypothetical protein